MFFTISKLFWFVAIPGNFLIGLLLISSFCCLFRRTQRIGKIGLGTVVVFSLLIWTTPLPQWSLAVLEERFSSPKELPEKIAGIIVLGGAIQPFATRVTGMPQVNDSAERYLEAAYLSQRFPDAIIIHSGGAGSFFNQVDTEAAASVPVFNRMSVASDRVRYEATSRNTYENAVNTAKLVDQSHGPWVLVTSAWHMPRAVGCFRKQGLDVVAYPVDYRVSVGGYRLRPISFRKRLQNLELAVKEWIGLVVYSVTNRIDSVFPRPN